MTWLVISVREDDGSNPHVYQSDDKDESIRYAKANRELSLSHKSFHPRIYHIIPLAHVLAAPEIVGVLKDVDSFFEGLDGPIPTAARDALRKAGEK